MSRRRSRFRTIVPRGKLRKEAPALPTPEAKRTLDPYIELGATGLKRSAGYVQEEFLRELQGTKGAQIYREMVDNSSIIGASLHAIKSLVRKAEWTWESPESEQEQEKPDDSAPDAPERDAPFAEDKPSEKRVRKAFPPAEDEPIEDDDDEEGTDLPGGQPDPAEFMEQCFQDMSSSWPDTLTEILTFIEYGYAPMEITYKLREGWEKLAERPGESSRYDDGYIGLRKMSIRAQETVAEWRFDDKGGVQGLVQQAAPNYQRVEIPIQKLLLFRATTEKNNPEGRSMLRSAYFDHYICKKLIEVSAIGAERDLAGLPVAKIPGQVLEDSNSTLAVAYRKIVENVRNDEQGGLVIPSDVDPDSKQPLYDFSLLQGGGSKAFDIKALIERHEARMAMCLGTEFLLLGFTEVGARSLGESKVDLFSMSLESVMDAVCEVVNRHLVPRLFALNGWPLDKLPVLKHGNVSKAEVSSAMEMLKGLTAAGADVFPDEKLVRHFYQMLKWPTEGRDELLEMLAEREEELAVQREDQLNQLNENGGKPPADPNAPPGQPPAAGAPPPPPPKLVPKPPVEDK
jgi:hypothetical protein